MIDKLIAFLRSKLRWVIAVLVLVVLLLVVVPIMAEPKVDVEIYKNRESGEMTYCETGTLVDPPMEHMGSGKIRESKASGC
jgi:hypothetical protein